LILRDLAEIFQRDGKRGFVRAANQWESRGGYPKIQQITPENRDRAIRESEAFRKEVRGVQVGSLG